MGAKSESVDINDVVSEVSSWMGDHFIGSSISGACIHWAARSVIALRDRGVEAFLQAGTSQFRRCENDPAERFSYVYTPGEHNALVVISGVMPEMHCWAATKDGWIIDLTSSFQKEQYEKHCVGWIDEIGFTFRQPDFIWSDSESFDMYSPAVYKPYREACILMGFMIQQENQLQLDDQGYREIQRCLTRFG